MLVEEAAGLGRFKRRRHRAELKLARVATQVERARDVEREVAKRLRPLALQRRRPSARRSSRRDRLAPRGDRGDRHARPRRPDRRRPRTKKGIHRGAGRRRGGAGGAARAERGRAEDALAEAAGGREGSAATLYRLRSVRSGWSCGSSPPRGCSSGCARHRRSSTPACSSRRASPTPRSCARPRDRRARGAAAGRAGARGGGRAAGARPGRGRARVRARGRRGRGCRADRGDACGGVGTPRERARARPGQPDRPRARRAGSASRGIEVVGVHELLAARGPAVTLEGHFFDPDRAVLSFTGDTAEAVLLELEAQRRALVEEAHELRRRAEQAEPRVTDPRLVSAATTVGRGDLGGDSRRRAAPGAAARGV